MARDYYEVLGVPRDASPEQIQQAFRTLARRYHPDINKDPGAEDRFKEINEANHVLSDPETRRRYDRFGEDFRRIPEDWDERAERVGAGAGGFGGGAVGGGGGSGRRVRFGQGGFGGGAGINIEDLFGDIFSGGGGRGGFGPIPGADQEAELDLSLEEAYQGGRRQITLDGRTYTVNIPRGVTDGQRIRLAGEGGRGSGDGPAGDLYLVVRIRPHPRFRLDGRDIYTDLPVSPWEAVLGATVAIRTPGGEAKVKVPPGSSTGRRLRLRGEGMPNPRGKPGDLYAEIKIVVPSKPTERERELFEQLARVSNFDPRKGR
ncbi:MAG: DnaJ-class molecular chaperone with C-terminal Zn finger domain [Mycobacterium sp.]|nr:DnaJ-class molecular chaperone with C-terminal Zn finger domain [Mycobacterium sp.]